MDGTLKWLENTDIRKLFHKKIVIRRPGLVNLETEISNLSYKSFDAKAF